MKQLTEEQKKLHELFISGPENREIAIMQAEYFGLTEDKLWYMLNSKVQKLRIELIHNLINSIMKEYNYDAPTELKKFIDSGAIIISEEAKKDKDIIQDYKLLQLIQEDLLMILGLTATTPAAKIEEMLETFRTYRRITLEDYNYESLFLHNTYITFTGISAAAGIAPYDVSDDTMDYLYMDADSLEFLLHCELRLKQGISEEELFSNKKCDLNDETSKLDKCYDLTIDDVNYDYIEGDLLHTCFIYQAMQLKDEDAQKFFTMIKKMKPHVQTNS